MPFFIGALITLVMGGAGGSVRPMAHLLVSDEDSTFVSRALVNVFDQGQLREMVRLQEVSTAEGEALMAEGKATALLVIPEGFGLALLREEKGQLRLLENPAQRILP